jgi:hypothetical protein
MARESRMSDSDGFEEPERSVAESLSIVAGRLRPGALTVFSVMRNERFLLPVFLRHYRALGVEQFLILSDRSDDGTTEMFEAEPDCVVLASTYAYGDWLDLPPGGPVRRRRAGVLMKSMIPRRYLAGSIAVYADADEFLILPPSMRHLGDLVTSMTEASTDAHFASMIEMYPQRYSDLLQDVPAPATLDDLLRIAPYFDAHPVIRPEPHAPKPVIVGESASVRLFRHFAIGSRRRIFDPLPLALRRRFTRRVYVSPLYKTPVVHFRPGVDLEGSHDVTGARHSPMLLGLLHFKFTPDSVQKVERIIAEKSHSRNSRKYVGYRELFAEMARTDGSFMYPRSERYESPASLVRSGLAKDA